MKTKSKLLMVYGDSLSMPRASDDVPWEATFPAIVVRGLRKHGPVELFHRGSGSATCRTLHDRLVQDAFYFSSLSEKNILIQCGIVDAAPRPLPGLGKKILGRLPGCIRSPVVRFLHDNRARILSGGFSWRETEPDIFLNMMGKMTQKALEMGDRVLVMNIAPTNEATEKHSPGLSSSIILYNGLITEAVQGARVALIDCHKAILAQSEGIRNCINPKDGHHLTVAGHALYGKLLLDSLL